MRKSKLIKFFIGLLTIVILISVIRCNFHYFSNDQFIHDDKNVSWEMFDKHMLESLKKCKSEFEEVCLIRQFAYSHIDWSSESNLRVGDSSVQEIYEYYENDLGGGYCGLAARYLVKLYDHYGFKSCTYDMGEPENKATHVTVIVQIEHEDRVINSIQDPTFNFTIVDSISQPIDLSNLMNQVSLGENKYNLLESNTKEYTEYLTNYRFVPVQCYNYIPNFTKISNSNGQKFKYSLKTKRTLERYTQQFGERYIEAFNNYNLPNQMTSLFVLPINECQCNSDSLKTIIEKDINELAVTKNKLH